MAFCPTNVQRKWHLQGKKLYFVAINEKSKACLAFEVAGMRIELMTSGL